MQHTGHNCFHFAQIILREAAHAFMLDMKNSKNAEHSRNSAKLLHATLSTPEHFIVQPAYGLEVLW